MFRFATRPDGSQTRTALRVLFTRFRSVIIWGGGGWREEEVGEGARATSPINVHFSAFCQLDFTTCYKIENYNSNMSKEKGMTRNFMPH